MIKYVKLNVNSIIKNVRNYLTDIFCLCLHFGKNIFIEQYFVID